jgi:hypothetical protein
MESYVFPKPRQVERIVNYAKNLDPKAVTLHVAGSPRTSLSASTPGAFTVLSKGVRRARAACNMGTKKPKRNIVKEAPSPFSDI